jgi:hypothetical protein
MTGWTPDISQMTIIVVGVIQGIGLGFHLRAAQRRDSVHDVIRAAGRRNSSFPPMTGSPTL